MSTFWGGFMSILVINPPNKPFTNRTLLAEPLDVLQIATIIKDKFNNVKVIDMDVNRMDNNIKDYLEDKNIVVFVYDYQLPLHTSSTIDNIFEIIKNTTKETKFIIIGKTSTYYYEKFLNNGFDVVIRGIADKTINEVIDNIYSVESLKKIPNIAFKNNNQIVLNAQKQIENNFSTLPMINRDFVDISKYMDTRTLISSRGCIGTCKFCTTPYYFKKWNGKSAEDVVKEIEMLINKYQAKKIMFLDDNATVDKSRMIKICELIKTRNIKFLFVALCSIKCYDKEMLEKMYEAGFRWIHFGLESGSQRLLKTMNKEMNVERIKQIILEVKNMGYRVRASFILDYPGTTKEDLLKTKELILSIKPHELRLHYLAYRVGTPVFEENKNISNKSQYIHNNKPNVENNELTNEIDVLLDDLKSNDYNLITDEFNWNKFNYSDKETRIAAFTPIKYGMCWYE